MNEGQLPTNQLHGINWGHITTMCVSGFYLGFEIWGEAIIDNVAVGDGCGRGCAPSCAKREN